MSDNLPPEVMQEELEARLRIPTEVWTDVFKLLPRRVLVQQIAPVCYKFKEISNKNVKNVHVIENATQFSKKLEDDDPEANQQLENLAANNCQLASQFKLTKVRISEKSKTILRDCPDQFKGCQITLDIREENKESTVFLGCLDQLEKAKPDIIYVNQRVDQVIDYWHHRTFLNCSRIELAFCSGLSAATMKNIIDWLHHQPNGVDCDASADQQVRCMILWVSGTSQDHLDWLINHCSGNIQQSLKPIDRRSFVLSFACLNWSGFGHFQRIENKSTGEVLTLERKVRANGHATNLYRLRRCLIEEVANGAEFYAGLFKQGYVIDMFDIGDETPEVMIK